ncbi:DUF2085 domain-containing protein [Myroides ceti]|uniref:DUF2085 domain-containing protein n=1 Tax=Paenimyroides ceti TaxID=395087 RepID=A0ABT8D524_9FLAO|nr:DUF2085 domain-containing protein [Paenimyroides ceti]MDN3706550.1 DUF2085 domain-containing protein [Paenimyroides ceti]MDN3710296.1 DUF2085 domain-containing protein [Paenimyroides ceti]MDN3710334.1 DUF2085 domain-containing protein [Paenimyroides ceti]
MDKRRLHITFCHRKPERSLFWRGKQFPVCARCTGIHIGYITFPLFMFNFFTLNVWWTLALILPTYIDGITQVFFKRESNNFLRVTTGLMAGIGGMSLVAIIGKYIGNQILLIFK